MSDVLLLGLGGPNLLMLGFEVGEAAVATLSVNPRYRNAVDDFRSWANDE